MEGGAYNGRKLSTGTIRVIDAIQRQSFDKLRRLRLSGNILNGLLDNAYRYGRHLFQREIISWKFFSDGNGTPSDHHR